MIKNLSVLVLLMLSGWMFAATPVADNLTATVACKGGKLAPGACPPGQAITMGVFGPQSSTFAADNDFDFAETFDGLQDWVKNPPLSEGGVGESAGDNLKMPRLANGTDSVWNYYTSWEAPGVSRTWIGDNGTNPDGSTSVWRGTKALTIDLSAEARGPSRLGMILSQGYSDVVHYFFMVNIPKNEFPTSCTQAGVPSDCTSSALGIYDANATQYAEIGSWKFITFNYGCGGWNCWYGPTGGGGYSPIWEITSHIKKYNYSTYSDYASIGHGITGGIEQYGLFHKDEDERGFNKRHVVWGVYGLTKLNNRLGNWYGVEFKIEQIGCNTYRTTWIYDQAGNELNVIPPITPYPTVNCGPNYTWDFFTHGGNNSSHWNWGPTMRGAYNVDDVIIDDKRIGPKYFQAIGN